MLPFSTASVSGRTAVVEEDSDEDEEETEDDGQDGPEERGVALTYGNLK